MLKFSWCDRREMIYTVSKEDYEQKGYLTVEKVLKKRMGLSDREISRILCRCRKQWNVQKQERVWLSCL